jgi:hypothetical protein
MHAMQSPALRQLRTPTVPCRVASRCSNTLLTRIIFPNRRNMASWTGRCREGLGLRYLEGPDDHDLSSR